MPVFSAISISNFSLGAKAQRGFNIPPYPAPPTTIDYVMIAGGGGGGSGGSPITVGGGGGAGGYLAGVGLPVTHSITFNIGVGGGGSAGAPGSDGSNSTLEYGNPASPTKSIITATGGGGGGGGNPGDSNVGKTGRTGGSGGGGAQSCGSPFNNGGAGTPGQGFAGSRGALKNEPFTPGGVGPGNGGGAGGAGSSGLQGLGYGNQGAGEAQPMFSSWFLGAPSNGGHGGQGVTITFDGGTSYVGGGGGGGNDLFGPSGPSAATSSYGGRAPNWQGPNGLGSPGPWNGQTYGAGSGAGTPGYGVNGSNRTGGGGGGSSAPGGNNGGNGGSGFVWIKYPSTAAELGETTGLDSYTDNGTSRIYKWSGAGSFKWLAPGVNPNP